MLIALLLVPFWHRLRLVSAAVAAQMIALRYTFIAVLCRLHYDQCNCAITFELHRELTP
jgi:hypothetical protein